MIKSKHRYGILGAVLLPGVVVGGLLVASPAGATGTLDQSQSLANGGTNVTVAGTHWVAQTFTAGITGYLDQVDVFVTRDAASTADLTAHIEAASDEVPAGSVLASTTMPYGNVNEFPSFGWVSFPLGAPVPVIAGKQYAIVLSSPGGTYYWGDWAGDPYLGGRLVLSLDSGLSWGAFQTVFNDFDTSFKTYVSPLSAEQCKQGGWRVFGFKNLGNCLSYVRQHSALL